MLSLKIISRAIICATLIVVSTGLYAQLKIIGPECTVPQTEYQYIIDGVTAKATEMSVCITGGIITGNKSDCYNGKPVNFIRVVWNEQTQSGKIKLTASGQKHELKINITSELLGGTLDSLKFRSAKSASRPPSIFCSDATGGGCFPKYSYQWEQSDDNIKWRPVDNATNQSLQFKEPITNSLFYRRKVVEKNSSTIAYSDVVFLRLENESKKSK